MIPLENYLISHGFTLFTRGIRRIWSRMEPDSLAQKITTIYEDRHLSGRYPSEFINFTDKAKVDLSGTIHLLWPTTDDTSRYVRSAGNLLLGRLETQGTNTLYLPKDDVRLDLTMEDSILHDYRTEEGTTARLYLSDSTVSNVDLKTTLVTAYKVRVINCTFNHSYDKGFYVINDAYDADFIRTDPEIVQSTLEVDTVDSGYRRIVCQNFSKYERVIKADGYYLVPRAAVVYDPAQADQRFFWVNIMDFAGTMGEFTEMIAKPASQWSFIVLSKDDDEATIRRTLLDWGHRIMAEIQL